MKKNWLAISTGFALFSMFFGSGNLVFPILVGQESGGHHFLAALGLLVTGVFVPFLGVLAMVLYRGDLNQFFRCLGARGSFCFSLFALSLMGPFGVLARCLTVAHGALLLLLPQLSLPVTSLLLCFIIYFLTVNKNKIVPLLGLLLTPLLLLSIAVIAYRGFHESSLQPLAEVAGWEALKNGCLQGYLIMDLLASFFFSNFIIKHLQSDSADKKGSAIRTFFKASFIGGMLLSLVYIALVLLGARYAPILQQVAPQEMLGRIALEALGPLAAPIVSLVVVLACLTTAMVLTVLFADFVSTSVAPRRIAGKQALLITLCIGFLVSTLDFAGITKFLGPILEAIYPALIALTVFNIIYKVCQRPKRVSENYNCS